MVVDVTLFVYFSCVTATWRLKLNALINVMPKTQNWYVIATAK